MDPVAMPAALPLLQGRLEECVALAPGPARKPAPVVFPAEASLQVVTAPRSGGHAGSRLLVLDGLRAIAICMVMVHHYTQGMRNVGFGDRVFHDVANSCWVGVDLFFVLSGFLITGILYDAKGSPSYFRTFYIRRSLRIFPIYYVLLLLVFVILPPLGLGLVNEDTLHEGPWFWFYGANYLAGLKHWPDTAVVHLWSLAIEEHFYLVWPVVVFLCTKRQLLIGGVALILFMIGLRYFSSTHGTSNTAIYVMTHYRIGTLVIGGLLALAWRTPDLRATLSRHGGKAALLLLVAGLLGLVTKSQGIDWRYWSSGQQAVGYTMIAVFFVAVHVVCLGLVPGTLFYRLLSSAPALLIGRLSYGMYLFHRPIEVVAMRLGLHPVDHPGHGDWPSWPYALAYIVANAVVTALVAWLTWNLFEKHVLRLKDRFVYQKSGGLPPSKAVAGEAISDRIE